VRDHDLEYHSAHQKHFSARDITQEAEKMEKEGERMSGEVLLRVHKLHKEFGPTIALKEVDFSLRRGEIHGLVGENGSGKSTIMSIASGMQPPTSGEMVYKGKPWAPRSMVESQAAGISMILQEANTIPRVTVAQNIFAGREKEFATFGIIKMRKMYRAADQLLAKFGITSIRGHYPIDRCAFEDRKLMELVRCVNEDTEILVVDETTSALSHEGRDILYGIVHRMAEEQNKAVVFISHDLEEIVEHCNTLTVLRDGEIVGNLSRQEVLAPDAPQRIRHLMVGREIGDKYYREDYDISHSDEVALEIDNISFGPIRGFCLKLHRGEIIGLGGLSGCGMHEIGRAAYRLEKLTRGRVLRNGKEIHTPLDAIYSGVGYISKNRDAEALILEGSIGDNIVLPSLPALGRRGFISPAKEKKMYRREIEAFRIKCENGRQWVNTLSGGNKQKVSFAKWTAKDSEVLIMDCPTRGVDVGVKQAMYALIEQMKKDGKAILMISEELTELLGMADRLLILKDFKVTAEFSRSPDLKQTDIIQHMI
jgi:ribose transport system ATP-binding protein